jgi:hypothetical protein
VRFPRELNLALLAAGAGCGVFLADIGDDHPPTANGGSDASPEVASTAEGGADGTATDGGTPSCAGDAHAFCEDFDLGDGASPSLVRWDKVFAPQRMDLVTNEVTSPPFAFRVRGPVNALSAETPHLVKGLSAGQKRVACAVRLRATIDNAKGGIPLEVRVDGDGSHLLIATLFLYSDAFQLGAYVAFPDGGTGYAPLFERHAAPWKTNVVSISLELETSPARIKFVVDGAPAGTVAVPAGWYPTPIARAYVKLGGFRFDEPDGGSAELVYDDLTCDVE